MDYDSLLKACEEDLKTVDAIHQYDQVKSRYLGVKSVLKQQLSTLSSMPKAQKAVQGKAIHQFKRSLESLFATKKDSLGEALERARLAEDCVDVTVDSVAYWKGAEHPLSLTQKRLVSMFAKLGFDLVDGPEIETFYYNFTALNTPKYHPAVTSQDTFYLSNGSLLRSHTSSVQIRMMEQHKPPLRVISPGRVFRADTPDATHSPCFMQCEGLVVDTASSLLDLRATLVNILEGFFEKKLKVRFRSSFFPFTEPSFECDIWFNGQWLEVFGCGMVHPNVLENVGVDSSIYQGFAFGMGIERLTMLRYNIDDIRLLYEGDQAFLQQFSEDGL